MKKWTGWAEVYLGTLTEQDIKDSSDGLFADRDNPTEAEIKAYFRGRQDDYASSNTGSEELANAHVEIEAYEE